MVFNNLDFIDVGSFCSCFPSDSIIDKNVINAQPRANIQPGKVLTSLHFHYSH